MKRILFIIPFVPYPLTSGGNQAFFNMVDYIRHKMSVSVLFYAWSDEDKKRADDLSSLWQNVDFHVYASEKKESAKQPVVKNPLYYKWLKKLKSSVERKMKRQILLPQNDGSDLLANKDFAREKSVLPDSLFKELDEQYVDFVVNIANSGFDIIQVEFYELIALGYVLPPNVHTIFVHHELRYIRNENEMALFKKVLSNDIMQYLIAKDFEQDALKKYKYVIALTEIDRQLISGFIGQDHSIFASPAVVQIETSSTMEFFPCTHSRFTFVGYGEHFPNLDAVVWFSKEIAPCLRKRGFEFTFQVAGKGYERYQNELQKACPEMEFVGFVENLKSFLQGSIALVPIRIGSGMRMKILDIVSCNVPFITTSKGLEGISFTHDKECLIADNAVNIADSMVELSNNIVMQERLVAQASTKLKELYNPHEMLKRRLSVYSTILNNEV